MVLLIIVIIAAIIAIVVNVTKSAPSHEQTQRELAAKLDGGGETDGGVDALLSDLELMRLKTEVMIQSKIVGDAKIYEAVLNNEYDGPWPEPRDDGGYLSIYDDLRILKIAGINYRQGINRYTGRVMCALVPEPNNEYDPEAIKIVAEDRHHLGYIPTGQTDFVRSLAGDTFPYRCEAHIYEAEDEGNGHKFFYGFVYIRRAAVAQQHTERTEKGKGE